MCRTQCVEEAQAEESSRLEPRGPELNQQAAPKSGVCSAPSERFSVGEQMIVGTGPISKGAGRAEMVQKQRAEPLA